METIRFDSHGATCEAWHLPAESDELTNGQGRPCVVMAHGFGCTRDGGLLPFAHRFAAAGADVLVFDYRGYAGSSGTPRQDVNHLRHRQDYVSAVAFARSLPQVDPNRIVLWGTSYSGGHVIAVAARDKRIAAVISQGAAMDGFAALLKMRTKGQKPTPAAKAKVRALTSGVARDVVRSMTRSEPVMVPVFGETDSTALIATDGGAESFQAILGPTFRNEMCGRGLLRIATNRPVTFASRVSCPLFLVLAERDEIAPADSVRRVARKAPRSEMLSFPSGHFEIYVGDVFDRSVQAQVDFLTRHVGARGSVSNPV
ncbi:MAG: alpha/beta fold hydrolase [Actinomycetota bacterium]|nr:alpha/beta fold hydrolase [Actinomycetota bacterium]